MEISHFKVEALSLILIFTLRMNISYYIFCVCFYVMQYQKQSSIKSSIKNRVASYQSSIKNISYYVCGRPTHREQFAAENKCCRSFARVEQAPSKQGKTQAPKLSPDLKKVGSWILKNTGLSRNIEEHFQFSTHIRIILSYFLLFHLRL